MKNNKHYIAYLLLMVLFVGVTPRDIIHSLHSHQDTNCSKVTHSSIIDRMHTHCDFLQLQLSAFQVITSAVVALVLIISTSKLAYLFNNLSFGVLERDMPRGPPVGQ